MIRMSFYVTFNNFWRTVNLFLHANVPAIVIWDNLENLSKKLSIFFHLGGGVFSPKVQLIHSHMFVPITFSWQGIQSTIFAITVMETQCLILKYSPTINNAKQYVLVICFAKHSKLFKLQNLQRICYLIW